MERDNQAICSFGLGVGHLNPEPERKRNERDLTAVRSTTSRTTRTRRQMRKWVSKAMSASVFFDYPVSCSFASSW
jgi:hypothetical protein